MVDGCFYDTSNEMAPRPCPRPLGVIRVARPKGPSKVSGQEGHLSPDGARRPGSPPGREHVPGTDTRLTAVAVALTYETEARGPPPAFGGDTATVALRPRLLHGQACQGLIRGNQPPGPRQLTEQVRPEDTGAGPQHRAARGSPTPCLLTPWAGGKPCAQDNGLGGCCACQWPERAPSPDPGRASPFGWCPQGGTSEPQATIWASLGPGCLGWVGEAEGQKKGQEEGQWAPLGGFWPRPVGGWGGDGLGLSLHGLPMDRAGETGTHLGQACLQRSPGLAAWVGGDSVPPACAARGVGGRPDCSPRCLREPRGASPARLVVVGAEPRWVALDVDSSWCHLPGW